MSALNVNDAGSPGAASFSRSKPWTWISPASSVVTLSRIVSPFFTLIFRLPPTGWPSTRWMTVASGKRRRRLDACVVDVVVEGAVDVVVVADDDVDVDRRSASARRNR